MSDGATTRYLEADVRCYHCGHSAGALRRRPNGRAARMVFRRHSDGGYVLVRNRAALRCPRCAGSVLAEEFEWRYHYRPELDQTVGPRRERPPTWLVNQRQAERLAAGQRVDQAGA